MRMLAAFFLFSMAAGCVDLGPEGEEARFIPGVSVDGVTIGMSWEEAVKILGEGYSIGSWDGAPESGYLLGYRTGPHSGITLYCAEHGMLRPNFGPIFRIETSEAYTGRTKEGIGIGSTREEVLSAFGAPARSTEAHGLPSSDLYWMNGKEVWFFYQQGIVRQMSLR